MYSELLSTDYLWNFI